ncbi:uncharacterized protein [Dendrobates tinctorius]|uniref:uncharacterized protein n=1 Tax=Dendrobates tinctorius TaxID=92724 RepID=UPI003CC937BB
MEKQQSKNLAFSRRELNWMPELRAERITSDPAGRRLPYIHSEIPDVQSHSTCSDDRFFPSRSISLPPFTSRGSSSDIRGEGENELITGYHDRLVIERAWFAVAEQLYPRPGWATYSPAKQVKFVDLVKRRWRSARDQFRWEFNPLPSTTGASKKRQYVYYRNLAFLRPILELNPTYDNLDDSDDLPTPDRSLACTSASETEPPADPTPPTQPEQVSDAGEASTDAAQGSTQ